MKQGRLMVEKMIHLMPVLDAEFPALAKDAPLLEGTEGPMLQGLLDDLATAMKTTDRQRIRDLSHKIDEVSAPFAQRRIERDLQLALTGRSTISVADDLGIQD